MTSSIRLRHTGQSFTSLAHLQHMSECPHGFRTLCTGMSRQILHVVIPVRLPSLRHRRRGSASARRLSEPRTLGQPNLRHVRVRHQLQVLHRENLRARERRTCVDRPRSTKSRSDPAGSCAGGDARADPPAPDTSELLLRSLDPRARSLSRCSASLVSGRTALAAALGRLEPRPFGRLCSRHEPPLEDRLIARRPGECDRQEDPSVSVVPLLGHTRCTRTCSAGSGGCTRGTASGHFGATTRGEARRVEPGQASVTWG